MILGLDTSTAATAAAVWAPERPGVRGARRSGGGRAARGHAEPPARARRGGARPAPARAGTTSSGSPSGVGPGGFTGLRHGIATARALAQGRGLPLAGVSSLEALARGAAEHAGERPVLAVIDARRGEVFAAAWHGAERLLEPVAIDPAELAASLERRAACRPPGRRGRGGTLQGAARAGRGLVPEDRSPAHRVSALQVCRLGAAGEVTDRDRLVPDYLREPDAYQPRP